MVANHRSRQRRVVLGFLWSRDVTGEQPATPGVAVWAGAKSILLFLWSLDEKCQSSGIRTEKIDLGAKSKQTKKAFCSSFPPPASFRCLFRGVLEENAAVTMKRERTWKGLCVGLTFWEWAFRQKQMGLYAPSQNPWFLLDKFTFHITAENAPDFPPPSPRAFAQPPWEGQENWSCPLELGTWDSELRPISFH